MQPPNNVKLMNYQLFHLYSNEQWISISLAIRGVSFLVGNVFRLRLHTTVIYRKKPTASVFKKGTKEEGLKNNQLDIEASLSSRELNICSAIEPNWQDLLRLSGILHRNKSARLFQIEFFNAYMYAKK